MTRESWKSGIGLFLAVAAGVILFAYVFFYRYPLSTLRAFVSRSKSMCPTVCEGERVFARMLNGKKYIPARGDVVMFEHAPGQPLYLKRVIGLPGDTIAPGPNNSILVNGQPLQPPQVCGKSSVEAADNRDVIQFQPTKVPAGQIFLIGDNLNNSFDSRTPAFGPAWPKQVVGKPVFIYWSSDFSRIDCPIR